MKNEKGSISLFVLIAMIFFSIYTLAIYNSISNSQVVQLKANERIKEIYEKDINNVDAIYSNIISNMDSNL